MIVALNCCLNFSIPPWKLRSHSNRRNSSQQTSVSQITNAESDSLIQHTTRRRCECYDMYKEVVPFAEAWSWQQSIVEKRKTLIDINEDDSDSLIILQHQPVYTLGTASTENNLNFDIKDSPLPLYQTERGGEVTYHGPGQLVMYPILNLRYQKMDLHWYLRALEEVVIRVLFSTFSLKASRIEGLTGVWVGDKKVAAIGIRVSRWLTYHGLALNVCTDLSPFKQIIPCGIRDRGVGSIKGLLKGSNEHSLKSLYGDDDDDVTQDGTGTPFSTCGTQLASTTTFKPVVDSLLSDLRNATPKAFNFYVALTKEITSEDETVYGIGQCVGNKTVCETCMNTAYNKSNNCLPSKEGRFFNMGCFARYSKTPLFNQTTTDVTSVLKGNSSKATIIGGTVTGVVLFILILVFWLLYRLRKAKKIEQADLKGTVKYSYRDLQLATNNFCEENILGRGGFGEVFKANLDVKTVVAVKKLQVHHARSKDEFENEVKLITHIHHRNLLRLLGWSSEGSDLLLVLEYMPNGSLDQFLWGAKRGTLDWNQRYEIIFGIARGLAHLHNEFHVKIIHRDIKSSNILLTDDFKPKIADFGLARFQPEDQSHVNTKFAGTLGYTAPEYALQGHLSDKVDTYSFGVVILEIISGRRSTEVNRSSSDFLLEHAWKLYEKKIHKKCIDETLDLKQYEQEHVMNIIEIALLCTQSPVLKRPTMCEVVLMLQDGQSVGKRQLIRPSFGYNHDTRIHIES